MLEAQHRVRLNPAKLAHQSGEHADNVHDSRRASQRTEYGIRLVIKGGRPAEQKDVMDFVPPCRKALTKYAGNLLRAGSFSLRLDHHDAALATHQADVGGYTRGRDAGFDGLPVRYPLTHGRIPFSLMNAAFVRAEAEPNEGSRPTRRWHATVSASAMRAAEMLQAITAPIKPNRVPRIAIRINRSTRPAAMILG